jgi:hypothetical protein
MKMLLIPLLATVVSTGCTSPSGDQGKPADCKPTGSVPLVESRMTVDEFMAAIHEGKTVADLKDRLGIPLLSSMRVHYMLADGTVTQGIGEKTGTLTIRRKRTNEDTVIHQRRP